MLSFVLTALTASALGIQPAIALNDSVARLPGMSTRS
jgi:hypothetical protein